uniref:Protein FAM116A n=1 Tax=Anthurium amnicola TaxID=1678845 RepID=A0A1D1ZDB7_9ARAE
MNHHPPASPAGATAEGEPVEQPDAEALRRWVQAFCVIRFDLEQGQVVEECYPPGALPAADELGVAFSSFPDSMSHHQPRHRSTIHDSVFFFRLRSSSAACGSGFLYGYVFNRQRQDERLRRGGEQKSVVILSPRPYASVFRPLLQILGPLCFDIGKRALELVAAHVASWPSPFPGKLMELPIGSAVLKVHLPPPLSFPSHTSDGGGDRNGGDELVMSATVAPFPPANPSIPQGLFHEADIFGIFRGILLQLWMLWELLIIGEPLLVIAPTPSQCSEAVAGLVSLVAPLLCSIDFRPYFTIHDPDFAHLNSLGEGDEFPRMVLGVTNLFFLKALRNIPHIVSVGSPSPNSSRFQVASRSASTGSGKNTRLGKLNLQQLSLNKLSPTSLLNAMKLRRDGPLSLMTEHKEAIWSTYSVTTKPDTSVLNRLIDAGMSPRIEESMSIVNNEILRRHFLELTTNFLAPFGPYLRAVTPSEGTSPFGEPPLLAPFHADEFLKSLAARGPGKFLSKRMRANWLDLYRRFLRGHNFMPWFQRRRAIAEQEQQRLWRQARMSADIQKLISKMSELEIVDSFNAIEYHLLGEIQLEQSGRGNADSALACQKLKGDLHAVFGLLPQDTQQLLLYNPQRAALLRGNL